MSFNKPPKTTTTTTTVAPTSNGMKNALCVGINDYPGTANDLRGCVNDALEWSDLLKNTYGYAVTMLLNADASPQNFTKALKKLVANAVDGSHTVITYSGHGTNVADTNGDEPDGRDEAICLYGGNLIDDDIRAILKDINPASKLTFISDSCHSGTVTRAFLFAISDLVIPRYLPPEDEMEAYGISAKDVSGRIMLPESGMKEILISGCQPTEYSYDASFNGKAYGAMTYYATMVLRQNPNITYNDFYSKLREKLPSGSYPQTPLLEGSDEHKNQIVFS